MFANIQKAIGILLIVAGFFVIFMDAPQEVYGQVLRVITPTQGGTGIGSTTVGNVGNCLKVLDDSPFTYELGTCGGGGGGADTNWAYNSANNFVYSDSGSTTATTSARSYFFTGTSTTDANTFPLASTTALTASRGFISQLFSGLATATKQSVGGGGPETIQNMRTNANDLMLWSGLADDTEGRFLIESQGLMGWGAGGSSDQDINFYRSGAGALTVQSGTTNSTDAFRVNQFSGGTGTAVLTVNTVSAYVSTPWLLVNGAGGGAKMDVYGGGTTAIRAEQPSESDVAFSAFKTSDAQLRFSFLADGTQKWGSGSLAGDTQLYRTGAGHLSLIPAGASTEARLGIGSTTPSRALTVSGDIIAANLTATGSATFGYASTTALSVSGQTYLGYASSTGISGTNLNFTSATTTNVFSTNASTTRFWGSDLSACNGTTQALGWSAGKFNCGSITPVGDGVSNWNFNGTRLTPSTTVGIGVFASSTIGNGLAGGGLTVNGPATTTGLLNVGGYGNTLQSSITSPTAFFNASTSGRSGVIFQNYGTGTAPEYRFTVGDPYSTNDYIAFGLTNSGATTPGVLAALSKNRTGYLITQDRDLVIGNFQFSGGIENTYIGANLSASNATPPQIKIDGTTGRIGINIATTTTPTSTLSVNGDIYTANIIATGTATTTGLFSTLGTFTNAVINTLLTAVGAVFTGLVDIGAGVLEIPNGSAPTVDSIGELALDSTSNQLVLYGSEKKVIGNGNIYSSFTYATSTAWTGTTTIPLGTAYIAETWNGIQCFTNAGTLNVSVSDGTNRMNSNNASTTVGTTVFTTNNTFTANEKRYVDIGTPASSPTKISCTVSKSITAD